MWSPWQLLFVAALWICAVGAVNKRWINRCFHGRTEKCASNPEECYYPYQRCDRDKDCEDGSDEFGCTYTDRDCPWDQEGKSGFCYTTTKCVKRSYGYCPCRPECGAGSKCCDDGLKCYTDAQRCDKVEDCLGGDDEWLCMNIDIWPTWKMFLVIMLPTGCVIAVFTVCFVVHRRRRMAALTNTPMVTGGGAIMVSGTGGGIVVAGAQPQTMQMATYTTPYAVPQQSGPQPYHQLPQQPYQHAPPQQYQQVPPVQYQPAPQAYPSAPSGAYPPYPTGADMVRPPAYNTVMQGSSKA